MSVVDEVKARLDIVDIVSAHVQLQRSGRHFKANCPFHSEKTPSFIVNPERDSWRCFGACATGGDVFSFVMRMEGLDFADALRLLAEKTGVSLSRGRDTDRSEDLFRVNQLAARFYRDTLESDQGTAALRYLEERGVDQKTGSRFELGLSPMQWDGLKSHLLALGVTEGQAVEAGLLHRGDKGNTWDFFRGRLMFPIHERKGRVSGFGARALDDSTPKYLNTPKTPVFDKRSTLYGLNLASESIRERKSGIVVEGYMDVIAAHQYGYSNVVASMGTALTAEQVSQLKSLATNFVLALDPDVAGQEATLRSLESSWRVFERQVAHTAKSSVGVLYQRAPLALTIAALPAGRDPDRLIREETGEWDRLTGEAVPLMDYLIPAVASRFDVGTGQGKTQVVEALLPLIESAEFLEQERYTRMLAEALHIGVDQLKASIGRKSAGGRSRRYGTAETEQREVSEALLSASPDDSLEDYTLALVLNRPELKERANILRPEFFRKSEAREVFTSWLSCSTVDELRDSLDESLHELLARLSGKELVNSDLQVSEAALDQCARRLERRHLHDVQEGLLTTDGANVPPPREIEAPISSVNARLKDLFSQTTR